jgi:hypothetical protein
MERVATGNVRGTERAVVEGGRAIENPMTMEEPQLWAALAVKPIDREALEARSQMWDVGRRSLRLGMIVTLLIFLTVPPIYLLESFVPLLIGGPLIVIAALFGSFRALAPGGEMDQGYEKVGLAMAPLGFEVTERPKVDIETRDAVSGRVGPKIRGALVLSGERHWRPVSVRLGSGEVSSTSEVTVGVATTEFEAKSRDGKGAPAQGRARRDRRGAGDRAELDPLEESQGRGGPRGNRGQPQGRRAGRLALRPLARRAPRRRGLSAAQPPRSTSSAKLRSPS